MRKLTVKNFSVIKDAELEFGKITVLIGPQSSGKSLLCKLAYFLGKEIIELAAKSILDGVPREIFGREACKGFLTRFPNLYTEAEKGAYSIVNFQSSDYWISVEWNNSREILLNFSEVFEKTYSTLLVAFAENSSPMSGAYFPGEISRNAQREDVWNVLNQLLSGGERVLLQPLYIPAGRAFFSNVLKGTAVLQNAQLDAITREFANQVRWDRSWKIGLLTSGRGITDDINRWMTMIAEGFVVMDSGTPYFLAEDGRKLPLELTSTAIQELAPLFDVLEQLMFFREHNSAYSGAIFEPPRPNRPFESKPLIYLEEPEANIFPKTQYQLVQLFSWLSSDPTLGFSWVITTHSPYVLSSFNDLIQAGIVGTQGKLHSEVNAIIPEKYWVKPGDFRAYSIHEGKLETIMDEETGLINGGYLDAISNKIGGDFDALLRIGYAKSHS
jgi:hypothetical protein